MNQQLSQSFKQFDRQTNNKIFAHIKLSNLYLQVERGEVQMSVTVSQKLQHLAGFVYPYRTETKMAEWWADEFTKLPNWHDY